MAGADERPAGVEARGTVCDPCPKCGELIGKDRLTCGHCHYKRKFDQEQYALLLECSAAGDVSAWRNRSGGNLLGPIDLEGAELTWVKLPGIVLRGAHLAGARLHDAQLPGADLRRADLRGVDLTSAKLFRAQMQGSTLQGAGFRRADLSHTKAEAAEVDGRTTLWNCEIDRKTNFTGVGLRSARVQPRLLGLLERNVRAKAWRQWYGSLPPAERLLAGVVRLFWYASDYGHSTTRVIVSFGVAALVFALAYTTCPWLVGGEGLGDLVWPYRLVRAAYFSVVTMTTLGFGDIHANLDLSGWRFVLSHAVLCVHVIVGYALLGALITRFATMFTGPAAPYVSEERLSRVRARRRLARERRRQCWAWVCGKLAVVPTRLTRREPQDESPGQQPGE